MKSNYDDIETINKNEEKTLAYKIGQIVGGILFLTIAVCGASILMAATIKIIHNIFM